MPLFCSSFSSFNVFIDSFKKLDLNYINFFLILEGKFLKWIVGMYDLIYLISCFYYLDNVYSSRMKFKI